MDILRVISRSSRLALLQVDEFLSQLPDLRHEIRVVDSYGDKHKELSLMADIEADFFTRELDRALLDGEADIAIHSAKDLPYPLPPGLELVCLTRAGDKTDSLVSRDCLTLVQLPSGSRVGTSSRMRKEELLRIRPDLEVVSIRGTIEERISQVDNGYVDALVVATCALKRLELSDRIAEVLPFKTHPLQGNLAVVAKSGNSKLRKLFEEKDIRKNFGHVSLVGFGPGEPNLLTIAGDRALKDADIIFHDDLLDKKYLSMCKGEKVYVGKRNGRKNIHCQEEINELVYQAALAGKRTVRLKGGDPMIFAHGREEIDYLKSRFVAVDVIPGVSSGIAMASLTQIPLTHRGVSSSVAFVVGHGENIQTPNADTLVYYMGGSNIDVIAKSLLQAGRKRLTPVALVYDVSRRDQLVFYSTLGELRYSTLKNATPLIIVVGGVVDLQRASSTQNVLHTGTVVLNCEVGDVIKHTPLIRIEKRHIKDYEKETIRALDFDYIIFTSRYGVRYFFTCMEELGMKKECLERIQIISVGQITSNALRDYGINPDVESPTESAEGIVEYFLSKGIRSKKILLPRSDKALSYISDSLKDIGNDITDIAVYENIINEKAERVDLTSIQKIIFSSPSGVDAFIRIYGSLPDKTLLVAKGQTTYNKLKGYLYEEI